MSRISRAEAIAGPPKSLDPTNQQRLEQMEQLATIFASIFDDLTLEQRANYTRDSTYQKAA
jgi:hypothetical protein